MKKVLKAVIFLFAPRLFAATFFSGEAGLAANFINQKSFGIDPALTFSGFLGGQLAISNFLSLQGEFSIQTADLYENGFSKEAESIFRINEISGTFTKSLGGATHSLTLFKGFNESIGSQKFISRRLGTENYTSLLTESYLGQNCLLPYEIFGTGGSYSMTLREYPASFGLVISRNNENAEDVSQLNCDFRFATQFRYLTLDCLAGLGAPLYTKNSSDEDVVLLIDTLYLHGGADLLLGNKHSVAALFLQCGFEYLPVKSNDKSKDFELDDMFIILEPRFKFNDARLYISFFNIPDSKLMSAQLTGKNILIEDTFGIDLQMFAQTIYKNRRNYSTGVHCMVGFEGKHFMDFSDKDFMDKMNIKICPFTEIDADGGKFSVLLSANLTKFTESESGAIKLQLGYKKAL